jgi:hypothetical protein
MKKKLFVWGISLIVTALFVVSCSVETKQQEGTFIVQNKSYDPSLAITDVWLRNSESMDWINKWHGSCAGESGLITELSFSMPSGAYDIRIKVEKYGFFYNFYETGYLQSVRISTGEYKFIIFDGLGIYDMESQQ